MTVGRVSQAAGEVLWQASPVARSTQKAAELLLRSVARARVGQQAAEVLRSVAGAPTSAHRRPILLIVAIG
jgi:hypothetical protein